jgi:hypothetical protein
MVSYAFHFITLFEVGRLTSWGQLSFELSSARLAGGTCGAAAGCG